MDQRLAELHIIEARRRALRLFCTGSTIIPEEYQDAISEQTVVDLTEFALHARRLNELCSLSPKIDPIVNADLQRYRVSGYSVALEKNYHKALNKLIHAKGYIIGYSIWDGEKIFLGSNKNVIPSYVKFSKEDHISCVSIFGISFCFLTQVIFRLKDKYPEMRF